MRKPRPILSIKTKPRHEIEAERLKALVSKAKRERERVE